jgi:chitin synthase
MVMTTYSEAHKLLFVIVDGTVTGAGNPKPTSELCLELMERDNSTVTPMSYSAIGDGTKRHNMALLYTGHYVCNNKRIPYLLINKCGTPDEQQDPKPGNRGKRDSQLILMQFLSKICFDERMTLFEYQLFEGIRSLVGVTPDLFEFVLMVDADTRIKDDSLSYMVSAMERDPNVMGLCGETRVANKVQSWVTMIQVYEYYVSHHLGKAFESIFGGVTCLPGCFCMYRIKAAKGDGYSVPILANPDIVQMYSSNDVSTLHKKNLLLLGEDRYLTTLMLRAYPHRKMIFVPKAVCKTVVPDSFKVLLSQRRRWINSTIHNLMELILVPQLCGIFCCSMQFVIFLEIIGTVVLPAALLFFLFLLVAAFFGGDVILPLLFMGIALLLQALLILLTTRRLIYIVWLIIYLVALPIWNLVLPLYAFWHFDDFSWGATRKVAGKDADHTGGDKDYGDLSLVLPTKRWQQWDAGSRQPIATTKKTKQQRVVSDQSGLYRKRHSQRAQHVESIDEVGELEARQYNRYSQKKRMSYA